MSEIVVKWPAMSEIVKFFVMNGQMKNSHHTFGSLMDMSDAERETNHRYIQWLFPLNTPSVHGPADAPVLTKEDIAKLKCSPLAQRRLRLATLSMLDFYQENHYWRFNGDHNMLRLTRMMKSLKLLGQHRMALRVYNFAMEAGNFHEHHSYWNEAMGFSNETVR